MRVEIRYRERTHPTTVVGYNFSQLINTTPPGEKEGYTLHIVHNVWGPGRMQNRLSYSSCIHLVENWLNFFFAGKFVVKNRIYRIIYIEIIYR